MRHTIGTVKNTDIEDGELAMKLIRAQLREKMGIVREFQVGIAKEAKNLGVPPAKLRALVGKLMRELLEEALEPPTRKHGKKKSARKKTRRP